MGQEKIWNLTKMSERIQMYPNASECIRLHPNGSGHVQNRHQMFEFYLFTTRWQEHPKTSMNSNQKLKCHNASTCVQTQCHLSTSEQTTPSRTHRDASNYTRNFSGRANDNCQKGQNWGTNSNQNKAKSQVKTRLKLKRKRGWHSNKIKAGTQAQSRLTLKRKWGWN